MILECTPLFYVECSSVREKLLVFITVEVKPGFMDYLSSIFGSENIYSYSDYIEMMNKQKES